VRQQMLAIYCRCRVSVSGPWRELSLFSVIVLHEEISCEEDCLPCLLELFTSLMIVQRRYIRSAALHVYTGLTEAMNYCLTASAPRLAARPHPCAHKANSTPDSLELPPLLLREPSRQSSRSIAVWPYGRISAGHDRRLERPPPHRFCVGSCTLVVKDESAFYSSQ
jgi:hypothetical protein